MRYIAAYLLLQLGGNASPSAKDIKGVLEAAAVDIDEDRLEKLIAELDGKDVNALIAEGSAKFASVPSGGAGGAAPAAAAGGAGGAAPEEKKEEEKKEEEKVRFVF